MLDRDVTFIIDAPITLAEGETGSWVQIAKTGKFKDPRYGTFKIAVEDFDRWILNFSTHVGAGEAGLPIDIDHGPETIGKTEAAGWVTKLEKRENDTQLWAFAEWNTLGRQLVGDKRYLYLSPSYQHDYKDETGAAHGTALRGIGLTNRPFLTMATVTLMAAPFAEELPADPEPDPTPDSPRRMPLLDDIKQRLGTKLSLSADADDAAVLAAIEGFTAPKLEPGSVKSLADAAKAEGMIVLSIDDHSKLAANAAAGATALAELTANKFEAVFTLAENEGRAVPAMKDGLKALYDMGVKAGDTKPVLDHIAGLPKLDMNLGEAKGERGGHVPGSGGDPAITGEENVDPDRLALHERAVALSAEKNIDYADAVMLASREAR